MCHYYQLNVKHQSINFIMNKPPSSPPPGWIHLSRPAQTLCSSPSPSQGGRNSAINTEQVSQLVQDKAWHGNWAMPTQSNQCDLRQDPSKLVVGDSHHHWDLQHFLPLEKLFYFICQKRTVHHGSKVNCLLNTRQATQSEQQRIQTSRLSSQVPLMWLKLWLYPEPGQNIFGVRGLMKD